MLTIYNSLAAKKEAFKPIKPGHISMYVCGNTVYDYCHLGHGRTMVAFDVIVRHLRAIGFDVNYVRNITDIDDKIIKRAEENNETISELTERMIEAQRADEKALNLLTPDSEPKATEHIKDIIELTQSLIDKGFAYAADNGDVYFEVSQFETYGKLSKKSLDELQAGHRVSVNTEKKHALDFVLWKAAKPGEPSWPSPWGDGRPGWHIECSAMVNNSLGKHIDIHGGGFDLQFPHHENEIAQSEACNGETFANVWMHTGFLQVDKEKMSKSLGNFFIIKDVLNDYPAEVLRYFFISSHYRSQLNYAKDTLDAAYESLKRLYQSMAGISDFSGAVCIDEWVLSFNEVMNDDFNTPKALSLLFELSKLANKSSNNTLKTNLVHTLKTLGNRLGLLTATPEAFLKLGVDIDESAIEAMIAERNKARKERNYQRADAIRDELLEQGIELLDSAEGTSWQKS